jgi:cell surface protein SprA
MVQTVITRRSFNVTNMGKQRSPTAKKPHIYDISNFTASYSYTEDLFRDIRTEYRNTYEHKGALVYAFQPKVVYWEPFKKSKSKSKWFKPIKEFNFTWMPRRLGASFNVDRDWNEFKLRNTTPYDLLILPTFRKNFIWSRSYEFQYDPFKSLKINFSAMNQSRVDEPEFNLDSTVNPRYRPLGRNTDYNHKFSVDYTLPINKFPIFDWITASAGYSGDYRWTASVMERNAQTGQFTRGRWGNIVQNSQSIKLNGALAFNSLFNKVPYLNRLKLEFAGGIGILMIEDDNFKHVEAFAGIERMFKIRQQLFRIGTYAVTSINTVEQSNFTFKVGINMYNAFSRRWDY